MTDTQQAVEFLSSIFVPGDITLFRPVETWEENSQRRARVDYRAIAYGLHGRRNGEGDEWQASTAAIEAVVNRQIERASTERTNLFFGTCPRFGGQGKYELAWHIRTIRALWADIDDTDDPAVLHERCKAAGLPEPSIIVHSGNGLHAYWLAEPYLIDDAGEPQPVHIEWTEGKGGKRRARKYIDGDNGEKLWLDIRANVPALSPKAQHATDVLQGIARSIGGDHTFDLARLLRLPGTLNQKNARNGQEPKPCRVIESHPERRYPFSDFEKFAEQAPDRQRREKISRVKLPTARKLTPRKADRLAEKLAACDAAPVGERSEADFHLLCFCVEQGVDRAEVWAQVQSVGKFAEAGERYFRTTWAKAEGHTREKIYEKVEKRKRPKRRDKKPADSESEELPVANVEISEDEEGNEVAEPLPMREVVARIFNASDNWPRRVDDALFVDATPRGVTWLESPAALFGWLQDRHGTIDWKRVEGCVNRDETFAEIIRNATPYSEVLTLPHEPPIEGVYYSGKTPEPGDGSTLAAFIDFFRPETPVDRELLAAVVATPLWGGPPGARPAAMFTATTGRGRGKSKLAQFVGRLYGGTLDIDPQGDIATIKSRLLSPGAASRRIALLDNVKSTRFSWGELEALITADTVSGKQLYVGEAARPNYLTWLITLNGASLSTDMAQRVVEVRLADPNYDDGWEGRVAAFVRSRQMQIIGDLIAFLRQPAKQMQRHSRWATWEAAILSRVEHPDDCLRTILDRRAENYFAGKLRWLGFDTERDDVFLDNGLACQWYADATGDRGKRTAGVVRALRQLRNERRLWRLLPYRAGGSGKRGFRWIGEHRTVDTPIDFTIRKRLAEKAGTTDPEEADDF